MKKQMKHQQRKRKGDKEEGREEKEKGDKVIPEDMEEEKWRLEMRRECFEVEEQKVMRKKWRERDKEKRGGGETRDKG